MNETLYDLEQKRKAVEQDIQALYETLKKEIITTGKPVVCFTPIRGDYWLSP